jgi:hypothetical protein
VKEKIKSALRRICAFGNGAPLAGAIIGLSVAGALAAGIFPGFTPLGTTAPSYQVFTGVETWPADTNLTQGQAPETILVSALQMGVPVLSDNASASASLTIPNGVTVFGLDTGTAATVTVTMPAAPTAAQTVVVACEVAIATSLTISPNTGQTIKGNPAAGACPLGTAYRFFFNQPTSQWFRF